MKCPPYSVVTRGVYFICSYRQNKQKSRFLQPLLVNVLTFRYYSCADAVNSQRQDTDTGTVSLNQPIGLIYHGKYWRTAVTIFTRLHPRAETMEFQRVCRLWRVALGTSTFSNTRRQRFARNRKQYSILSIPCCRAAHARLHQSDTPLRVTPEAYVSSRCLRRSSRKTRYERRVRTLVTSYSRFFCTRAFPFETFSRK